MTGFELTAFGPVPIGTPYLNPATTTPEQAAAYVVRPDYGNEATFAIGTPEAAQVASVAPPVVQAPPRRAAAVAPATSPKSVIASAKARVKQIKAELKRLRSLQSELGELERLLKAAKQKPTPSVRPLRSVG